ncbi:RYamide receptor [Hydra vulgaris]|uniref:RYamide receptor n=1 Tax=Hydra vulgaris TaxID=6087 RepID=A0ABM4BA17_HYDVU
MTSLALSDFLKAVAAPLRIILLLTRFLGNYGCKLFAFLSTMSTTVSAITLLSVSIDRLIIVKWPLHQRPHRRNLICIITFIWFASGCLGSVYLVRDHITYDRNFSMCSANMKKQISDGLTFGIFTIQTLVPITLFTIMYFLIIFELKKTAKSKALFDSHRVIAIRLQQNSKTIKMVVFAVVIFYVCILPSNIYYLWYEFSQHALSFQTAGTMYDILVLLEICSSIGNPILYSRLLTTFRREIIKIVFFCCQKKSVNRRKSLSEIIRCSLLYNSALHLKDRSSTKTSNC